MRSPWVPFVVLGVLAGAGPLRAEDPAADLDQRVRVLERRLEVADEVAAEKAKTAATFSAGKDGFSWKSADGAYSLKIRGYLHVDGRFFAGDDRRPQTSGLLIRRVRPIIEVTAAKSFDFRIMPDWGGGTAALQDGYVEWRRSPALRARVGKFKPPLGFERLQSATEMVFIERAFPTSLVPNRDIGLQLSGDVSGGVVTWAAGVFNGVADGGSGDGDTNDNKELAGRILATPFKKSTSPDLRGLSFAVAASVSRPEGSPASTGLGSIRSEGQSTIFAYRVGSGTTAATTTAFADGKHTRLSPQGQWFWRRLGVLGEWVESTQEITLDVDTIEHEVSAWQVTGVVLLTADEAAPKGVSPKRPYDSSQGQWGAVELDARYQKLTVGDNAFPILANPASSVEGAKAWGAGVTWTLSRNVKLVADYVRTEFEGGAANGEDRETERAIFARTQFAF
ncbi:MAG: OprO/OprP family phosphate-selective porin [Candidatus Eiseniibacteriota bacterium]